MNKHITVVLVFLSLPLHAALAQYGSWQHSGTLALLTTPEGADVPATTRVEDFPVLVRLNRDFFDFGQAKANGADIRFSAKGQPLAYQIEHWDPGAGVACIWVRVPMIRGNARQAINMHWGKADAASESNGAAVFNESNGFVAVMHLAGAKDAVKDELGTVSPEDAGTTPCVGVIGVGRHFEPGQGVACGEKIARLPSGLGPNTTEAWFRAERANATVVGWGNEKEQGKVVMDVLSPPHARIDGYYSGADVAGGSRLPMSQWVHVAHSYQPGDSRLYVNGRLDGVSNNRGAPLNIRNPARMWLGGWYGDYRFAGDIDEVRISRVARSSDWVRLEYENQKPLQTLVGVLMQPGNSLAVSPQKATIDEGKSATFTARTAGAEKVYWVLKRDGTENVVAVDCLSYTLDAGRIQHDTACVLELKVIYPDKVRTIDVPIVIKDTIPDPDFTLQSPKNWNGRDPIEVVPVISNLAAMRATAHGDLHYAWNVVGGAVIKQVAPDRLVLKRSQYTGPIRVRLAVDNGGAAVSDEVEIQVTEPKSDPWVERKPDADEKPAEGQFYARDDKNEGTLYYNGAIAYDADSIFLKVFADDKPFKSETRPLAAGNRYAFTVKLKPGLVKYRVEFGIITRGKEKVLHKVGDLVCGDAYLINGQSNALATDTEEESPRETNEWIRSYGGPTGRDDGTSWVRDHFYVAARRLRAGDAPPTLNLWCKPVWKANRPEHKAELGWWGMQLAKRLLVSQKIPIFILNGAVGGTRIDEHQPAPGNHADLNTIYGRMLWRVQQSKLTHGIRAVIWHQGESNQSADGPTGGYDWETYQRFFVEMSAAWKEDMPNIRHYYVFQIWPNACDIAGDQGTGDLLREAQRTLPRLYSNMSIMSTLGIKPPGGCHYPLTGWSKFARLIQPLIERDFYGRIPAGTVTPPDLRRAYYATSAKDEIVLEFDQALGPWHNGLASQFYLDGRSGQVASGRVAENDIVLRLKDRSAAEKITYLKERAWSQENLIVGANGIAALTFCDVPLKTRGAKP